MSVIDWIQTCQFLRGSTSNSFLNIKTKKFFFSENIERFILYGLCGGLIGVIIILLIIIFVLYREVNMETTSTIDPDYDLSQTYLPVYRYNDRFLSNFISNI